MVKILIERLDIDRNRVVGGGSKPLFGATPEGHEGDVQVLLLWDDTNPHTVTIYGRTPLFKAARKGHEGVVEMLLERLVLILILWTRMAKHCYPRPLISGVKAVFSTVPDSCCLSIQCFQPSLADLVCTAGQGIRPRYTWWDCRLTARPYSLNENGSA